MKKPPYNTGAAIATIATTIASLLYPAPVSAQLFRGLVTNDRGTPATCDTNRALIAVSNQSYQSGNLWFECVGVNNIPRDSLPWGALTPEQQRQATAVLFEEMSKKAGGFDKLSEQQQPAYILFLLERQTSGRNPNRAFYDLPTEKQNALIAFLLQKEQEPLVKLLLELRSDGHEVTRWKEYKEGAPFSLKIPDEEFSLKKWADRFHKALNSDQLSSEDTKTIESAIRTLFSIPDNVPISSNLLVRHISSNYSSNNQSSIRDFKEDLINQMGGNEPLSSKMNENVYFLKWVDGFHKFLNSDQLSSKQKEGMKRAIHLLFKTDRNVPISTDFLAKNICKGDHTDLWNAIDSFQQKLRQIMGDNYPTVSEHKENALRDFLNRNQSRELIRFLLNQIESKQSSNSTHNPPDPSATPYNVLVSFMSFDGQGR